MSQEIGIDLENIVYYRGDTHYFVMTALKNCLLKRGVIKEDIDDRDRLLAPSNIGSYHTDYFISKFYHNGAIPLYQICGKFSFSKCFLIFQSSKDWNLKKAFIKFMVL